MLSLGTDEYVFGIAVPTFLSISSPVAAYTSLYCQRILILTPEAPEGDRTCERHINRTGYWVSKPADGFGRSAERRFRYEVHYEPGR